MQNSISLETYDSSSYKAISKFLKKVTTTLLMSDLILPYDCAADYIRRI